MAIMSSAPLQIIVQQVFRDYLYPMDQAKAVAFRRTKKIVAFSALLFWLTALFMPAYHVTRLRLVYGRECFSMGWGMLFMGKMIAFIAWFANIPFVVSVFITAQGKNPNKAGLVLSGVAFAFSLFAGMISDLPLNEGGTLHSVTAEPGMLVWMTGMLILLVGNSWLNKRFPADGR